MHSSLTQVIGLARKTGNDGWLIEIMFELRDGDLAIGFCYPFDLLEKPFGRFLAGRSFQVSVEEATLVSVIPFVATLTYRFTHSVKVFSQLFGPFVFTFLMRGFASF
jgi:hypothetical protein